MLAARLVAVVVVAVLGPVVLASYTCRITLFLPHTYPLASKMPRELPSTSAHAAFHHIDSQVNP